MTNNIPSPPVKRSLILIASMLAMFMAAVEVTIVATALPSIVADLGGFSQFGWIFSVYLLIQAVSVPIYGRLADIWGRKKVFFIGTSLFLLGSVLCGFASSMNLLIIFRAFQGLGAGAIMPLTATIIADVYSPQERAAVEGWLSSVWGFAAIIGPLIGAWLVEHAHWALIFWLNVPIGLISMAMLARWLPELGERHHTRINISGSLFMMITILAFLIALQQAHSLGYWIIPLLIIAIYSGLKLWQHEHHSNQPLFPPVIWRSKIHIAGNLGNFTIGAAMMGISAFLPTWIQGVTGGTPSQAGSTLAVMSIGWPLASIMTGRLIRCSSYRFTALVGTLLLSTGCSMLLLLNSTTSMFTAALIAFVIGSGLGITSTTFLVAVQNHAEYSIRGICTAATMFSRMLGSALGTVVMGTVLNLNLLMRLPHFGDPIQQIMSSSQRAALPEQTLRLLTEQVAHSLHWVFVVAFIFALTTLLIAKMLPQRQQQQ